MTERLLQYIWQFQYFNKTVLTTVEGESLQVINPGIHNTNQGPDFIDAKIKIDDTIWAGSIELHINSSEWKNHKHDGDTNYKNVVLHVVWQHDMDLHLPFSTLVLEDKVPKFLLSKYDELMKAGSFIPCEKNIRPLDHLTWLSWKERLLVERLQQRSASVFGLLKTNNNHWEEVFWWMLASNFGVQVNSIAFEKIARSIPMAVLAKHKNQVQQLEALLLGQAGLLENDLTEKYPQLLQKEYRFLQKKYQLQKVEAPVFFLRMRPANFPSLRLAQLAMLVHNSVHLFSSVKESKTIGGIKKLLNVTANDYWHYHYMLDEASAFKKKNTGTQMINNILINTIVPILFAYGSYHKENNYKEQAMQWLLETEPEKNRITKGFELLGIENENAFDSQALVELKNNYCDKKRCLDCAIGNKLLKSG
jgi:hypothetical protein